MRTDVARELGGFPEDYEIASGEDVDLGFATWVNSLDIVVDERVLVGHVSKGTAGTKLENWQELWKQNRNLFLEKWTDPDVAVPRIAACPESEWKRNRAAAVGAAGWMEQYFKTRDVLHATQRSEAAARDEAKAVGQAQVAKG